MEQFFVRILNIAISSSSVMLAVILTRIILSKAPRWSICLLWGLVAISLIIPFRFSTPFGLISGKMYFAETNMEEEAVLSESYRNEVLSDTGEEEQIIDAQAVDISNSKTRIRWTQVAGIVWILGISVMVLYAMISYLVLQRRVATAIPDGKGAYVCDNISTPFILGIIEPKIYIPSFLREEEKGYVVAHEIAHRKRGDYLSKFVAYCILSIYWFHPLVWISFILFGRDLEIACDESVIKDYDLTKKKGYAETLLNCSMKKRETIIYPLAFGKEGVKMRIKHIIDYKKPKLWTVVILAIMCIGISACLMTNPKEPESLSPLKTASDSVENRTDEGKEQAEVEIEENGETKKIVLHAFKDAVVTLYSPTGCTIQFESSDDMEGMDYNSSELIYYKINKQELGKWKQLNYGTTYEWHPIAIQDYSVELDWNDTYGKLPAGKYQIVVDTSDSFSGKNPDGEPTYGTTISQCEAEFEITE